MWREISIKTVFLFWVLFYCGIFLLADSFLDTSIAIQNMGIDRCILLIDEK